MKFFYRVGLLCVFILGIYFCYQYVQVLGLDEISFLKKEEAEKAPIIQNITVDSQGNILEMSEEVLEKYDEAGVIPEKLTCDTEYIIREYDKVTRKEESHTEQIPEQYIGKNRGEMEEIVAAYSNAPGLKDLEKGFVSMEIASFSPQKLVVLKKYYSDLSKEHFYLVVENGFITVYYSDLTTVYLYTDIVIEHLPEDLQNEMLDKKYMESEEELYNFLESYTS